MKKIILTMLLIFSLLSGNVVIAEEFGAGSDTYSIGKMYFSDLSGNEITKIDGSGMVNVTVTKNVTRSAVDSLIISSYSTDGEFIGLAVIRANIAVNCDTELGTMIKVPEGKELGLVKAYMWNNISDMTPLSGVAKKTVGDETADDIPEMVKVNARLSSSYKNNSSFGKYEYSFDDVQCLYDYIEGATDADYEALYGQFMLEDGCSFVAKSYLEDMDNFLIQDVTVTLELDEKMSPVVKQIERVYDDMAVQVDVSSAEMQNEYTIAVYDENSSLTRYELDSTCKLFVNGVRMDSFESTYINDSNCGDLILADSDNNGYYDAVLVEYWGTAVVDTVTSEKVFFADYIGFKGASVTLNPEDKAYDIYYEGEKIAIEELLPGDILSISYDVYESYLNNSCFCTIYVSRNVQKGVCSGYNAKEQTISLKTESGEMELKTVKEYEEIKSGMSLEAEYKVWLDYFGRLYSYEMVAIAAKYAIFDSVISSSEWDNIGAGLYFQDGTYDKIEINFSKISLTEDEIYEKIYLSSVYTDANKTPIENRVVKYKISSSTGEIISLEFLKGIESTAIYRTRTQAIGTVRMNDTTKIVDAMDYVKKEAPAYSYLSTASISSLVDGVEYTAYGFGEKNYDNTYPFVIITNAIVNYNEDTQLAVVTRAMAPTSKEDGTEGFQLTLLDREGEQIVFVTADVKLLVAGRTITVDSDNCADVLFKGDVIVFQADGYGDIDAIDLVWRTATFGDSDATVNEALTTDYDALISIPENAPTWTTAWNPINADLTTSVLYGVVVDKGDGYFKLAQVADGEIEYGYGEAVYNGLYTNLDEYVESGSNKLSNGGTLDITVNSDTVVYVYDSTRAKNSQFSIGGAGEITNTSILSVHHIEAKDGTMIIPWDMEFDGMTVSEQYSINLALAKVVNGVATEVFFIVG